MNNINNTNQINMNETKKNFCFNHPIDPNNRWIILENYIPWEYIEKLYSEYFVNNKNIGKKTISSRVAFGTLMIKKIKGLTNEETVQEIMESPYLQYFIGYKEYTCKKPFDTSAIIHFKNRFTDEGLNKIYEKIEMNMHIKTNNSKYIASKKRKPLKAEQISLELKHIIDSIFPDEETKSIIKKARTNQRVTYKNYFKVVEKPKTKRKIKKRAKRN